MKNILLLSAATLFVFAWPNQGAAAPRPANTQAHMTTVHAIAAPINVAPADEYFGRMKISILGINNAIHDTNLRVQYDPAHAARYYPQLLWAQDSLYDWASKYPQDGWLPGRAYFMSHVFWEMRTPEGDVAAERCRALLFRQFPNSRYAGLAQSETKKIIAPPLPGEATTAAAREANAAAGKNKRT